MNDDAVHDVVIHFAEVAPRVTSDFVSKLDVTSVLGTFDTYFSRSGDQARRGQNIDIGASKLDGVVLMPGEIVSFNRIVGDRSDGKWISEELGDLQRRDGRRRRRRDVSGRVDASRGGVLRRARSARAAAALATERVHPDGPRLDRRLSDRRSQIAKPATRFPIVIHAKTEGNKLTIQLLGAGRPAKVTFAREVLDTKAYPRKVEEDARLSGQHVTVKQHGIRGYRVKRTRVLTFEDGRKKVETNIDVYPPTTEIYAVPPGFDESTLPPLPTDEEEPAAATPAQPTVDPSVTNVVYTDAPGAHAPTTSQKAPEKSLTLTR